MNQAKQERWDCDVLVIGSGAGALSAALSAALLGQKVRIVEKDPQYGGTSAWSGGWLWVPRNHLAQQAGIIESMDQPLSYLRHELGEYFDEKRVMAFLENAPLMLRFFESNSHLKWIDGNAIPDFHGNTPDSVRGGRSVCAAPFDARELGERFLDLKPPLKETTFLGMGIGAGADMRHFFQATRSFTSFVYVFKRILRLCFDWSVCRRARQLFNGNALVARLAKSLFELGVQIELNSPAKSLIKENGRVVGAVVLQGGQETRIRAKNGVILGTGGFPHDPKRKAELLPHDPRGDAHFSAASRGNTGDGLRMAEDVGACVERRVKSAAALAPVSLVPQKDGSFAHFPHLIERGKPGLVAVTHTGRRFTNEANSYFDFLSDLIKSLPEGEPTRAWLIVDSDFIKRYGLGAVKPFPIPHRNMLANGYLRRGVTLQALAVECDIDAAELEQTIERYNHMARLGFDAEFLKGQTPYNQMQGDASRGFVNPCMAPIERAPFYAVQVHAGSLGTFAGLKANEHAQVLDESNLPIPGLYAAGNDLSSVMGGNYPSGGITLGPAMTFGFIAAHHASSVLPVSHSSQGNTMYYEIATLTLPFGSAAQAASQVQTFCAAGQGELLGCWFTDIGVLNQMIVLRGFADLQTLQDERNRTQHHASPFGCADLYLKMEQQSFRGFPWMKPLRPSHESGIHGPVYEIRTYGIKPGGVQPTIDLWEQYVPAREKLSPCLVAMVALDGPLRFTNIWAYPTLDARSKARADAVAQGIWPPKGGPAHLTTDMVSTIAMPTLVSPLK